jgi:glyoxylase-like metal-dependent hydrolase (beta-lactamase superfamily II)
MKVHHIDASTLCPVAARLINGPGHPWLARGRMVCHCLVVETAVGLVLIDTGFGTADITDPVGRHGRLVPAVLGMPRDPALCALGRVRALGLDPRDVRHVVPTHLDLDHAGGVPDFPWADVHVHADELDAALRPRTLVERVRYRTLPRSGPRWVTHDDGGDRWLGFESIRPLAGCDDVLLVPLRGHTRGHCGVAVRTSTGWLLHAGDAYFDARELDPRPTCAAGLALFQRAIAVDDGARRRNQGRLRALRAGRPDVVIHCAHSGVELDALAQRL